MHHTNFENAFKTVKMLVDDFTSNKAYYTASSYSEQSVRHDFIDKFFIALGWDINHEKDKNPYEQEAKIELNVNVRGRKKRADYAFYLAPNFRDVIFYAEAKKPSVQIENADDYFQTIRYGYNSETPLAILTDFEQFHILDCRYAPVLDTAHERCVKKYTYADYLNKEKFAEIYYLFSREAVASRSIEKRALELPKARGGAIQTGLFRGAYKPIDEKLLDELDEYRNALAHAFKNGNPELDHWALTEIVQRVIDRLVFIRFLEDKLIEPDDIISNFGTKSESVWKDFVTTCRKLDKVYNGTIYKKHDILDTPDFKFDENVFAGICEKLSSKNTPYDFDKIPIHILGSIYERFLGKVITTTAKRAKVEPKPEIKKAGGVFYTPEYIVRYIVENTIGKLIKSKTPDEISKMHFTDIACGSGSFLLGAYDCILRYHANYYNKNPKKATVRDCIELDGALILTLHKKREILLNNIFGLDKDPQAVEVSQLSLYLKLLENETLGSTAASLRAETGETVLPHLGKNIQCGNSLIGTDFYHGEQIGMFDVEEKREVNAFDWKAGFPTIMENGGFDVIMGNPPWGGGIDNVLKYLKIVYKRTTKEHTDTFKIFIELSLRRLNTGGIVAMIVPNTLLRQSRLRDVRELMLDYKLLKIVDLGENVFANVVAPSCIFILQNEKPNSDHKVHSYNIANIDKKEKANRIQNIDSVGVSYEQNQLLKNPDLEFTSQTVQANATTIPLGQFEYFNLKDTGIQCQRKNVGKQKRTKSDLAERLFYQGDKHNQNDMMFWKGRDINRYYAAEKTDRYFRVSVTKNLKENEVAYYNEDVYKKVPKILLRQTADHIIGVVDYKMRWFDGSVIGIIPAKKSDYAIEYIMGILNSKYCKKNYQDLVQETGRVFAQVKLAKVKQLPIRVISFEKKADKNMHDKMVELVTSMHDLYKMPSAKSDFDKSFLVRQIDSLEQQIDELVYELYGLTVVERKIIQNAFK